MGGLRSTGRMKGVGHEIKACHFIAEVINFCQNGKDVVKYIVSCFQYSS